MKQTKPTTFDFEMAKQEIRWLTPRRSIELYPPEDADFDALRRCVRSYLHNYYPIPSRSFSMKSNRRGGYVTVTRTDQGDVIADDFSDLM